MSAAAATAHAGVSEYLRAGTMDEALEAIAAGATPFAGGTDLLTRPREPARVVDLRALPELQGVREQDGLIRIGAAVTLDDLLASHEPALPRALVAAARLSASPQLRRMATVGGSISHASRCPYWRTGADCPAGDPAAAITECRTVVEPGPRRSIMGDPHARCQSAHTSDVSAALLALGAEVELAGGERRPLAWRLDEGLPASAHAGSLVTAVWMASDRESAYEALLERSHFSWSTFGLALARDPAGGRFRAAAIGVAPVPWLLEALAASLDAGAPVEHGVAQQWSEAFALRGNEVHLAHLRAVCTAFVERALEHLE